MNKEPYTVPLPKGFKEEDLNKQSVFGGDYTLLQDLHLIVFFVDRLFPRPPEAKIKVIHKIFRTIQTKEWQTKFDPQETKIGYLLQVYEKMQFGSHKIIEISRIQFVTACMLIEGVFCPAYLKRGSRGSDLHEIVKDLFHELYSDLGVEMSTASAKAIKSIRNKIVHAGGATGDLYKKLPKESRDHLDSISLKMTVQHKDFIDYFIAEFEYLFEDMILRMFGLEQEDLAWNGRPAWASMYWK